MPTVWVWKVTCVLNGVVPPFITAGDADEAMHKVKLHLHQRGVNISSIAGVERIAHFQVETQQEQDALFAPTAGN